MKILAHRGLWNEDNEKNSLHSLSSAVIQGFGLETDIRDHSKSLIVSHDVGDETSHRTDEIFPKLAGTEGPIALNVKTDGIAQLLEKELIKYDLLNVTFCFDMSVPDMRSYINSKISVFGRISEFETKIPWGEKCDGVWLDSFETDWFSSNDIEYLLGIYRNVCVVSPELHHRNHEDTWERLKIISDSPGLMICTDFPKEAKAFFND